ncbi:MAG: hypothetical protein WBM99_12640, partial [Psychromonas sp.]
MVVDGICTIRRGLLLTSRLALCRPSLDASDLTFIVGVSPLTATLLFFERPKKSKQKKSRPSHFFDLALPNSF